MLFAERWLMSDAGLEAEEIGGVAGVSSWPVVAVLVK